MSLEINVIYLFTYLDFDIMHIQEQNAGFSNDRKFKLATNNGNLLLRIGTTIRFQKFNSEFEIFKKAWYFGAKSQKWRSK